MKDLNYQYVPVLIIILILLGCDKPRETAEDYYSQKQYATAYELFLPRARKGDAVAQNYIGTMHYLGLLGKRDVSKARDWFEKAAKQKLASAQLNYAMVIEQQGTQADEFLESYKWYYAAYENGNKEAEKRIKHLLEHHRIFHNQRAYAQKQMLPYIDYERAKKIETINY